MCDPSEYAQLMAERAALIDSGVSPDVLVLPIARNQAEIDAQIEGVRGPRGEMTLTCANSQCRVSTYRPTNDGRRYCPSCYGEGA